MDNMVLKCLSGHRVLLLENYHFFILRFKFCVDDKYLLDIHLYFSQGRGENYNMLLL